MCVYLTVFKLRLQHCVQAVCLIMLLNVIDATVLNFRVKAQLLLELIWSEIVVEFEFLISGAMRIITIILGD